MAVYRPPKSQYYVMDFLFCGKRIRKTTGLTTKTLAKKYEQNYIRDLEESRAGVKQQKQPDFFSQAADKWRTIKTRRWSVKMKLIAKYALEKLEPVFGNKLLIEIEPEDIARYQSKRLSAGASPRTVNIEVGILRQILKRVGVWDRIKNSDEWQDGGMLPERKDAGRALTAAEESMLILECRRSVSRSLLPFVMLSLDTGARYNTIRTLQWSQISFENRLVTIGKDKTEAGTGRIVPLSKRAIDTLTDWAVQFPDRKPNHFVFASESYKQTDNKGNFEIHKSDPNKPVGRIKTAWESAKRRTQRHCPECKTGILADKQKPAKGFACVECSFETDELPKGLVGLRLHDLRHSAVSRMVAARIPLTTIAKIVGWSNSTTVAMAARYSHPEETEMRAAVEAISQRVPSFSTVPDSDFRPMVN